MTTRIRSLRTAAALLLALASTFGTVGCGDKSATPAAEPAPAPAHGSAATPLTAAECAAAGGQVVGDIGDGAIHRPEYRCPNSGQPPLGAVAPEEGQPMAIEGAVCCR